MPETAAELRKRVIREITVAPGWNKEDATALVDELILSLPYIDDKNATREPCAEARALGRAEALADLRARLDAATDLGLYPLGGVRKATAAEPAWQEGWNAAMIAMAEAEDKFWDGLAAIDNLETPE